MKKFFMVFGVFCLIVLVGVTAICYHFRAEIKFGISSQLMGQAIVDGDMQNARGWAKVVGQVMREIAVREGTHPEDMVKEFNEAMFASFDRVAAQSGLDQAEKDRRRNGMKECATIIEQVCTGITPALLQELHKFSLELRKDPKVQEALRMIEKSDRITEQVSGFKLR